MRLLRTWQAAGSSATRQNNGLPVRASASGEGGHVLAITADIIRDNWTGLCTTVQFKLTARIGLQNAKEPP
jgi:hypothetical protein